MASLQNCPQHILKTGLVRTSQVLQSSASWPSTAMVLSLVSSLELGGWVCFSEKSMGEYNDFHSLSLPPSPSSLRLSLSQLCVVSWSMLSGRKMLPSRYCLDPWVVTWRIATLKIKVLSIAFCDKDTCVWGGEWEGAHTWWFRTAYNKWLTETIFHENAFDKNQTVLIMGKVICLSI